jgi:hypothetical protein|eukprot:scaffold27560_cov142-Isochrysis_galbana.AAC.2
MGDPSRYPEIRMARHIYALHLQWLPREVRDDRPLLQQWIDTTIYPTSTRARSWSSKMAMLTFVGTPGPLIITSTCPHVPPRRVPPMALVPRCVYVYGLSTPTAIIHSCPMCFNPQLPNPQSEYLPRPFHRRGFCSKRQTQKTKATARRELVHRHRGWGWGWNY